VALKQKVGRSRPFLVGEKQPPLVIQQPVIVDPGPITCTHITSMVTTCD
jgi:hypothetical protein